MIIQLQNDIKASDKEAILARSKVLTIKLRKSERKRTHILLALVKKNLISVSSDK